MPDVTLQELLRPLHIYRPEYQGDLNLLEMDLRNLVSDSRKATAEDGFIAVKGGKSDGHAFIPDLIARGVKIFFVEKGFIAPTDAALFVGFESIREALPQLARQFNSCPTDRMLCFGVTGTNGKTSTAYLLEHILKATGLRMGVLGTIDHHFEEHVWPTQHTTPEPLALQSRLAEMKRLGAEGVAMEVSSHALEQRRADGVLFNAVIFTNLTRDHLDYHGTEKEYFEAKERLFTDLLWQSQKLPLFAIVNADDPWGRRLRVASKAGIWTFGEQKRRDFRFKILSSSFSGVDFEMETPFGKVVGHSPLVGKHNLYNLVGAIAAVSSLGIHPGESLRHVQDFKGVPGRLERVVDPAGRRHVFIDYAHTPDALENVLKTLQNIRESSTEASAKDSRILCVFGCGGDRDRGKRPLMAQIAAQYADICYVTSDNPRSENPEDILAEIWSGFSDEQRQKARRIVDRNEAIGRALTEARPGDVILIAGKGHEDYQEIQGERRPFSDSGVAADWMERVPGGGPS